MILRQHQTKWTCKRLYIGLGKRGQHGILYQKCQKRDHEYYTRDHKCHTWNHEGVRTVILMLYIGSEMSYTRSRMLYKGSEMSCTGSRILFKGSKCHTWDYECYTRDQKCHTLDHECCTWDQKHYTMNKKKTEENSSRRQHSASAYYIALATLI